jgi:lysyl-tRNA synthetase class 1
MQWLNKIVDEIIARQPDGEVLIESGASPSGTYHLGHMREPLTCDAILLELRRRGRNARHVFFSDDLDALRKIPVDVPAEFEKYLGMPLCDVPAPDGSDRSYSEYFFAGYKEGVAALGVEVEPIYSHEKYRSGFFVTAIETALERLDKVRGAIEETSGRKLDEHWTPIQVMENGRLKNRKFVSLNKQDKTITYVDADSNEQTVRYDAGEVKLDWRIDWPARWWLLSVGVEPFGRDHASAGSSYDTGKQLVKDVFGGEAPLPVPYDFINLFGDTKKMSASKGTGISAVDCSKVMPAEVMRYFILGVPPSKRLYFNPAVDVVRLVDEFAELAAKAERTESEEQLLYLCTRGLNHRTVSRVPFSHLVTSYQAALKNVDTTLDVMRRTEHAQTVDEDKEIITQELKFIDAWLQRWAPEDVKFELRGDIDDGLRDDQKQFLAGLAEKISTAPADADGDWFHKAIYEFKQQSGVEPKELFQTLYKVLIGRDHGPRAGWFLSILPRDWLTKRLRLEA